jgi:hypothetical protein
MFRPRKAGGKVSERISIAGSVEYEIQLNKIRRIRADRSQPALHGYLPASTLIDYLPCFFSKSSGWAL